MPTVRPDLSEGRFRRVMSHPASLLGIGFALLVAVALLGSMAVNLAGLSGNGPLDFLGSVMIAGGVIAAYKGYKHVIERTTDRELDFARFLPELAGGLVAGFALFCAMAGLVALLGGLRIAGLGTGADFWAVLGMALVSGVFEEVLFRGVVMRHLEALVGTLGALALTSAFFGFAHVANPDSSVFVTLAISVEAGILLGAAYLVTRRLWLAIGIHAAWNFTQGFVFSAPVSGGQAPRGLLVTVREGPEWLTGGAFGLEASVVAMLVATAAGLFLLRRAARKGEIRPFRRWARLAGRAQTKL